MKEKGEGKGDGEKERGARISCTSLVNFFPLSLSAERRVSKGEGNNDALIVVFVQLHLKIRNGWLGGSLSDVVQPPLRIQRFTHAEPGRSSAERVLLPFPFL